MNLKLSEIQHWRNFFCTEGTEVQLSGVVNGAPTKKVNKLGVDSDGKIYYNLDCTWTPIDVSGGGGGGPLLPGEATTPNGNTLDWGGTVTHDVAINSDGVVPLPSIIFGQIQPFRTFAVMCNDFLLTLNDTLDVRCQVINFVSAVSTAIDCPNIQLTSVGGQMLNLDRAGKLYQIGDIQTVDHGSNITINDSTQKISITANNGVIIAAVQNFANNAAAITGGLVVGTIYRNNDILMIVH